MEPTIVWYQQSSIRIEAGGLQIYIDPYRVPEGEPKADVLLISHDHGDHLSPEDIGRVRSSKTKVFANPTAATKLDGDIAVLRPGDSATLDGLKIRAIPAYTTTKLRPSGEATHPKQSEHLGLILEIDDMTFYLAGDTDVIPEMESVGPVDYAFLPVSGRYVMTAEEAAEAARIVQPSVAVPVHYGAVVGSIEDARRFAELVPDQVRVWIMDSKTASN
jgi:L-ascorbate metabolism protein UlaG (beta-lactamase superfamily)